VSCEGPHAEARGKILYPREAVLKKNQVSVVVWYRASYAPLVPCEALGAYNL